MGFPIRRFDSNDRPLPLGTPAPPATNPLAPRTPPTTTPAPRITLTTSAPAISFRTHQLWPVPPLHMAHLTPPPTSQYLTTPAYLPSTEPSTISANRHSRRTRTADNTNRHLHPVPPAVTPRHTRRPALMRQNQATAGVLRSMVGEARTAAEVERSAGGSPNAT